MKNVKGYMDGINQTNFSVSAGYNFRLSKTFDLSGRFTREITEQFNRDYFTGINTNPSWSFQTFIIVKF